MLAVTRFLGPKNRLSLHSAFTGPRSGNALKESCMPRYIAFLRGINLGNRRVKMETLRNIFSALQFSQVSTFIASGNVIFETPRGKPAELETRIEDQLQRSLGYAVETLVRTPEELTTILAYQSFSSKDLEAEGHTLHVGFLRKSLDEPVKKNLLALQTKMDALHVKGKELYWLCRGKTTDSLVKWPVLMKLVATPSTLRNVKMLRRLMQTIS
jgi:uncharacterized protein (DUF1697 family)